MKTIAFAANKGGVGKTTLAVHAAAGMADSGQRVLFLDLDPQAHGSMVLGIDPGDRPSVGDTFGARPRYRLDEVIVPSTRRSNLWIAPACSRMTALERDLFYWGHRLQAIPRALKTLSQEVDAIVIDTPPFIGAYTEAALGMADLVVAPLPTGAFALQGLLDIETAWRGVREGEGLMVAVVNQWDRRTSATNAATEEAFAELSVPLLSARIPRSESINQAGLAYEVIFDESPKAPGVEELRQMAKELAHFVGLDRPKRAAK